MIRAMIGRFGVVSVSVASRCRHVHVTQLGHRPDPTITNHGALFYRTRPGWALFVRLRHALRLLPRHPPPVYVR